jgi:hypothetical protein
MQPSAPYGATGQPTCGRLYEAQIPKQLIWPDSFNSDPRRRGEHVAPSLRSGDALPLICIVAVPMTSFPQVTRLVVPIEMQHGFPARQRQLSNE